MTGWETDVEEMLKGTCQLRGPRYCCPLFQGAADADALIEAKLQNALYDRLIKD